MSQCLKCAKTAVAFIRYNGTHLCADHFSDYVRRRVKKEVRRQSRFPSGTRLGLAVSGGKDSSVLLELMHRIFRRNRGIELHALLVDEGIAGYRPSSIAMAKQLCAELEVPLAIRSFSDVVGCTLDEIVAQTRSRPLGPCSYCGVLRRRILNTMARELDLSFIAFGHNLDDMAQSILMNFVRADLTKMTRLGPHRVVRPGLIPRLMPLRTIPEKESYLYALLNNLAIHEPECPYAEEAHRQLPREIVNMLETRSPGTRHAILSSYDQLCEPLSQVVTEGDMGSMGSMGSIGRCEQCGEPASGSVCKVCEFRTHFERDECTAEGAMDPGTHTEPSGRTSM